MPRKKKRDFLSYLGTGERAHVLGEMLKRHPDLRDEAITIAKNLLYDVSVEAVAEDIAYRVTSISHEEFGNRAGKHSWGYVEPGQAAWDLLEESIEDVLADMKRRFEAGIAPAAEKICHGIILGLHMVDNTNNGDVLEWVPEFPAETAAWSMSLLLELYPQRQRRAAGNRILDAIREHVGDWGEMLHRVIDQVAAVR